MKTGKLYSLLLLTGAVLILISGCSRPLDRPPQPSGEKAPTSTGQQLPAASEATPELDCQETFLRRELAVPYQRQDGEQPRYTLSGEELVDYLDLMGIEEICIPQAFGAPFLNVDWNEEDLPAVGRMVSLGFEELYDGGGWSRAYLVYASYDFELGTEYDTFADRDDFQAIQSGERAATLTAGDAEGFIHYFQGMPMGGLVISKTYIFPFEDHYLAGVVNLGVYDAEEADQILAQMEAGTHPDLSQEIVLQMDGLIESLVFGP